MGKSSKYTAKTPDRNGQIAYTAEENAVWHDLITRQRPIVEKYACDDYLRALDACSSPPTASPSVRRFPRCCASTPVGKWRRCRR